ncbi:ATP-NAD kinase family protein [Pseudaestuariivita sp.]|uniref:ATP-NAD kinase family protein n=1 Tax=Pseudaestuariivita sp. TaxID=2211669 RepID=UPI0040597FD5
MPNLGFLVNPYAGLGGPLGQKGSDDPRLVAVAQEGGTPLSALSRAERAAAAFLQSSHGHTVVTGPGQLGQSCVPSAEVVSVPDVTHAAADTRAVVEAMQGRVDLILFCGGDGTARDVAAANRTGIPVLGVPAGVKMHSGVFARSPERAGQAAAAFLNAPGHPVELVEVLDIDEEARRRGRLSARLFSVVRSPVASGVRQNPKAGNGDMVAEVDAALGDYVRRMRPGCLYVLGPGTTMSALKDRLGGGTLLGVDLAQDKDIIARDLSEDQLLAHLEARAEARIVLTVVGGQGFLLGRGNQQISSRVIERVGPDRIDVICAIDKLNALEPQELTVDTGDTALDARLSGYCQVATGPGRRQVVRVVH